MDCFGAISMDRGTSEEVEGVEGRLWIWEDEVILEGIFLTGQGVWTDVDGVLDKNEVLV